LSTLGHFIAFRGRVTDTAFFPDVLTPHDANVKLVFAGAAMKDLLPVPDVHATRKQMLRF